MLETSPDNLAEVIKNPITQPEDPEPLMWPTKIKKIFIEFGQHIGKVNVEGSDRLCKVSPDVFQEGENVIFVRADVDIIFIEAISGFTAKHGVPEPKKPQRIMTTKYGQIGNYEVRGCLLKKPVPGEPHTWVLKKHVSSTNIEGGDFPTNLIKKTNEFNAENKPKLLKRLLNKLVDVTIKMDGQSITIIYQQGMPVKVYTRNSLLVDGDPMLDLAWFEERFPKYFDLIFPLEDVKSEDQIFAIQAEHIGDKTNANLHGYTEDKIFIFNIEEGKKRLTRDKMEKRLRLLIPDFPLKDVDIVPMVTTTTFDSLEEIYELAGKQRYDTSGVIAEGVIIRDHNDYSKSLKVINNKYEHKKKEVRYMKPKKEIKKVSVKP